MIGAGSFGTAIAVLLARGGIHTALLARTAETASELETKHENSRYLPGVELPAELRVRPLEKGVGRSEVVFLAVPSSAIPAVAARLPTLGVDRGTAFVSRAKGLVEPNGQTPAALLTELLGADRVAAVGGPSHAQEMARAGASLVAASREPVLAGRVAAALASSGVVCQASTDQLGVELAGVAKNVAALASGATQAQGLNAAGAAAAHIFSEVWRFAERGGARPETFIGLAGTGDLVATALAPQSRNRRAGELLAAGVPAEAIGQQIGQAIEAFQTVPLLDGALGDAGLPAPVTAALSGLIDGTLPLPEWIELVRTTTPIARRRRGGLFGWRY